MKFGVKFYGKRIERKRIEKEMKRKSWRYFRIKKSSKVLAVFQPFNSVINTFKKGYKTTKIPTVP